MRLVALVALHQQNVNLTSSDMVLFSFPAATPHFSAALPFFFLNSLLRVICRYKFINEWLWRLPLLAASFKIENEEWFKWEASSSKYPPESGVRVSWPMTNDQWPMTSECLSLCGLKRKWKRTSGRWKRYGGSSFSGSHSDGTRASDRRSSLSHCRSCLTMGRNDQQSKAAVELIVGSCHVISFSFPFHFGFGCKRDVSMQEISRCFISADIFKTN